MMRLYLITLTVLLSAGTQAQQCLDNYKTEAGFLGTTTYSTWARIQNTNKSDAFDRAKAFVIETEFTILSADKSNGAIIAANSQAYRTGKTVPLNIKLSEEGPGKLRLDVSYETPFGVNSPEDAIKKQLCNTIAVAEGRHPSIEGRSEPSQDISKAATEKIHRLSVLVLNLLRTDCHAWAMFVLTMESMN